MGLLARTQAHAATLAKGDALLIDSRVLHCGGANQSGEQLSQDEGGAPRAGRRRALFYFSLKRAGSATGKSGAGTLRAELRGGRYRIHDLGGL